MVSTQAANISLSTNPLEEHAPLDVELAALLFSVKEPAYSLETLHLIAGKVNEYCGLYKISPRIVMAQMIHETNWFRFGRDVQWWQFNFAGLGATGRIIGNSLVVFKGTSREVPKPTTPTSIGASFTVRWDEIDVERSVDLGVLAVVQHHAVYLYGTKGFWPSLAQLKPLVDPRYVHVINAGKEGTIKSLRDYSGQWAVDPAYADKIVPIANLLPTQEETIRMPTYRPYTMSIPLRVSHIPWGNPNRPGTKSLPSGRGFITVHETGNTSLGANAEMHRRFTHNGGGEGNVSFTYVVDDKEVIELLPRGEKSWQASDGANGPGNSSVSIEVCVNSDGNWSKTLSNLIELITYLVTNDRELSSARVVQHNHWAPDGKNCPTIMRGSGGRGWERMLAAARDKIARQVINPVTPPPPTPTRDPNALEVNGFWIINEILHKWESLGSNTLPLIGYPISGLFTGPVDGTQRPIQIFERGALAVYEEGTPDGVPKDHPFRVRMLTLQEQEEVVTNAIDAGILKPLA